MRSSFIIIVVVTIIILDVCKAELENGREQACSCIRRIPLGHVPHGQRRNGQRCFSASIAVTDVLRECM